MTPAIERFKSLVIGLLEAGLVITIVFSVATVFNEWHRFLELFSHFRLQYLGVSLLLTVAFVFLRWRSYALLGLASVALNAWFVVPWYWPAAPATDTEPDVTLMLSNVLASNGNADRFLRLVADRAPDVIVMQEATPAWLAMIATIESDYPHRVTEPREDPFGIALYSKLPIDAAAVNASAPLGFPEIVARLAVGQRHLNLISTHPVPPVAGSNYGARNLQLDAVARLAAGTPGPTVLVGDLNITMWANHYDRLIETSGLRNAREGFGAKPTWPLFLPFAMIPIDHCLVSDGITVTSFDTGPRIGSDHLPVIVGLALD